MNECSLLTKLGGRKFLITLGAGIMTTALQWFGHLDDNGTTFALVIAGTVGAYITGNVAQNKHELQEETKQEVIKHE